MKNYFLFLFLGFSLVAKAQAKITFDYDAAGNQTRRELCLSCPNPNAKKTPPKAIESLQEEDLQKFSPEDAISYYPNPVKEELYLKWELAPEKAVATIYLYDLNGRVLQTYANLSAANSLNLPFFNYPQGTYLVVLVYTDGEQKTIKIVK